MSALSNSPYVQRPDARAESSLGLAAWCARRLHDLVQRALAGAGVWTGGTRHARLAREVARALQADADDARALDPQALAAMRAALRRDGLGAVHRAQALALVARAGRATLGRTPYETQLQAALILLEGDLAEMATGEGKTYATALGAALWAMAGQPVHVMTANDYLVQRDAELMRPMFAALGLRVGCVVAASTPEQRRAAYACDVTYCTAREAAFDHLRDVRRGVAFRTDLQQRLGGLQGHGTQQPGDEEPALLRGLWTAVVDEADSLLVDEAGMPLLLSEHLDPRRGGAQAAARQRAIAFQSLTLARQLEQPEHFRLDPRTGRVRWTAAGHARVEALAAPLSGVWFNRRHRRDLLASALHALHGLQADRDYVVLEGAIKLLDPVTGRPAEGRVWSRGLQALVEMKEGCPLTPPTQVSARLSLQRFFSRYLHLSGMSGTLRECAGELRAAFGCRVVPVPRRLPSRLQRRPDRVFATDAQRRQAAVRRVRRLQRQGRPVLVATGSVQASVAMSQALLRAGIRHARLDARHDAGEAEVIARAGRAGAVTVATHMAGRGTDIALGEGVARLGGLHVLCCQDNTSARLDRQVIGRAGRQGEPGVAEVWRALDAKVWQPGPGWAGAVDRWVRARWLRALERAPSGEKAAVPAIVPGSLGLRWFAWRQAREEAVQAHLRRATVEQDLEWQQRTGRSLVQGL
jgi:preprotein translocase subunit SecA